MDWKEVGSAILDFAPTIGGALLGPPGAAMGVGIKALAGALGMSEDEITPEAALSRIQADPQVAADLKKADIAARVEIRKAELADVADARARDVAITKITGKRDINLYALAWLVVIGFFSTLTVLLLHAVPEGQDPILYVLLGALSSEFARVLAFFFGSSRGSKEKTNILADIQHYNKGR